MFSLKKILINNKIIFLTFVLSIFLVWLTSSAQANTIMTINDPTDADVDNGLCSITEAVLNGQYGDNVSGSIDCSEGVGSTIVFDLQVDITLTDKINLTQGITLNDTFIFQGNGHTISLDGGSPDSSLVTATDSSTFEFYDLIFTEGTAVASGGAVALDNPVSVLFDNVTFDSNFSPGEGGAVWINSSIETTTLTIVDSTFTSNSVSGYGGAIFLEDVESISITGSSFEENNQADENGAGAAAWIQNQNSIASVVIQNTYFLNNTSGNIAAGIYLENVEELEIIDSYFEGNVNFDDGEGLAYGGVGYFKESSIEVSGSTFYSNRPNTIKGGVFYLDDSTLTINKSSFENNVAGKGGVFYLSNESSLSAVNTSFLNNVSIDDGGVIFSDQLLSSTPNTISMNYITSQLGFSGQSAGRFFYNYCQDAGVNGCDDQNPATNSYIFENSVMGGCDASTIGFGGGGTMYETVFTNNLGSATCGGSAVLTNTSIDLEDNGGDIETFKLSSGSNAIDAGTAGTLGCPATDARGIARPVGSACDIGAFEYQAPAVILEESGGSTSVSESGATDTFTFSLGSHPSDTVTVTFSNDGNLTFSPTSVVFNPSDWLSDVVVTVSAVDDSETKQILMILLFLLL
ncbi:MAG: choice-of-anchor Q domain-containing protein [Candidatus Paceibacterota bacterium]